MRLVLQTGVLAGLSVTLGETPVLIGRHPECAIPLDDRSIALEHASICADGSARTFTIRHLAAEGETRLNGRPVANAILKQGDSVMVGDWELLILSTPSRGGEAEGVVHRTQLGPGEWGLRFRLSGLEPRQQEALFQIGLGAHAAIGSETGSPETAFLSHELDRLQESLTIHHWAWLTWGQGIDKLPASYTDDESWEARLDDRWPVILDSLCARQGVIQVGAEQEGGSLMLMPQIDPCGRFSMLILCRESSTRCFEPADLSFGALVAIRLGQSMQTLTCFGSSDSVYPLPATATDSGPAGEPDRWSGLGRVVSGFAHDLNKPLASLIGFLDLAERALDRGLEEVSEEKLSDLIRRAINAADYCRSISRKVLDFARQRPFEGPRSFVQLRDLLGRTVDLCTSSLNRAGASIEVQAPEDLEFLGDETAIQQMVMNLVTNAAESIRGAALSDGQIQVIASGSADRLEIKVSDNGPGVPDDIRGRILNPLFTTKEPSEGTGLGLHVVNSLAHACGGSLKLESTPGPGACFSVVLPRVATPTTSTPIESESEQLT